MRPRVWLGGERWGKGRDRKGKRHRASDEMMAELRRKRRGFSLFIFYIFLFFA